VTISPATVAAAAERAAVPPMAGGEARGEARVLLALAPGTELEPLIRRLVKAGVSPVGVESAVEGVLARLDRPSFELVLVDLRLGPEATVLARAIAERAPEVRAVGLWSGQRGDELRAAVAGGIERLAAVGSSTPDLRAVLAGISARDAFLASDLVHAVLEALATTTPPAQGSAVGEDSGLVRRVRHRIETPGTLRAVYQPIFDLRVRRVFGYLALTRFMDAPEEDTGREFAQARALGMGAELELAAAREAVGQAGRIPDGAVMFIKVSGATVATGELESILDLPLAPRVVLELSDHATLPEPRVLYDAMNRLREVGVRFSVDETAAGFSALDHMLDLAPAFVRLAGGLTHGIATDRTRRALALVVTSFATHLGARVIADRIESEEELTALRRLAVHFGLGFHLGRPADLPRPAAAAGVAATAAGSEDEAEGDGGPQIVWARARPSAPLIRPQHLQSFDTATRAVLRAVADRLGEPLTYVAQLDHEGHVLRVVDAEADALTTVSRGISRPLDASLEGLVAAGVAPQIADRGGDWDPAALAAADELGAGAWAVVPFAGAPERPLATVSALAAAPGALGGDALDLLRDAGAVLRRALEAEHGTAEQAQAKALRELSWLDPVTGLQNARRFGELLAEIDARAASGSSGDWVVRLTVTNLHAVVARMGQALAELVLKDVARALALAAEQFDTLARVGPTTYGAVLLARRVGEVEYFAAAVSDHLAAAARRRGVELDLRMGYERLGLARSVEVAWASADQARFRAP